jgi:hypothetical protein
MVNENGRQIPGQILYPAFRVIVSYAAPFVTAGIGGGIEEVFISAHNAALPRPVDRFVKGDRIGAETVIIEKKERHEVMCPAIALPHFIRVFRRENAELSADFHQIQILFLAPFRTGIVKPEIMITRDPYQSGEPLTKHFQGIDQFIVRWTDVTCEYKPVMGVDGDLGKGLPVAFVLKM